jgi:hypothetical protein
MATEAPRKIYGLAAEFSGVGPITEAAKQIRDAGYKRWDIYSPFPIHGIEKAMGLGKSWLSAVILFGGVSGVLTAFLLQNIPSIFLYPTIVDAKPVNFWTQPAFVNIMFELMVIFSAFFAVNGMLVFNRLPRFYHPLFNWDHFDKVYNDGFFLAIDASDEKYSETETRALLEKLGGFQITIVHD